MRDFRPIEAELIREFKAAGLVVQSHSGEAFVVALPIDECTTPNKCAAQYFGGKLRCSCLNDSLESDPRAACFRVSDLAKRIADL